MHDVYPGGCGPVLVPVSLLVALKLEQFVYCTKSMRIVSKNQCVNFCLCDLQEVI